MGIQLSGGSSIPSIVYDKVHMIDMEIEQADRNFETDPIKFEVSIRYRLYGTDPSGKMYLGDVEVLKYKDFVALVQEEAAKGNMTLANCYGAIELAIANLIELKHGIAGTVI